jgi:hypothetical protein
VLGSAVSVVPPNGGHVRVRGRSARGEQRGGAVRVAARLRGAAVTRRREECDSLTDRLREQRVLLVEQGWVHARLGLAEALRDDVTDVVLDHVLGRVEDVGVVVARRYGEHDVRTGRGHVRPLDVERRLDRPAELVGVVDVERRRRTRRRDLRVDGLGSPIVASKVCRSEAIVGLPKASTMTIVRPAPLMPRLSSGVMLYAFWIWAAW